jgi:hypothetical protein
MMAATTVMAGVVASVINNVSWGASEVPCAQAQQRMNVASRFALRA